MDDLDGLFRDPDAAGRLSAHLRGGAPSGLLRSLKVKLLSNCNLRCEMCKYWRIPKRGLPRERVFALLDDAAALGCRKVHFSGGEVTLYRDLEDVLEHAIKLGLRVNLTTNGVLVNRERAARWAELGLHAASFSLDGAKADVHDEIRGVAGAFKRTLRGMRNLRRAADKARAKTRVRVNCVLSAKNLADYPDVIDAAGELGAIDVVPMPIDGDFARPTAGEIRRYNAKIAPRVAERRRHFGMSLDAARVYPFGREESEIAYAAAGKYAFGYYAARPCYAPWLHAFVSHTGDVFACCMSRDKMPSLGNVVTENLRDLFVGPAYENFRRTMLRKRLAVCSRCDQFLPENKLVENRLELVNLGPLVRLNVANYSGPAPAESS